MTTKIRFPRELDVFMPILDAVTPISPTDLNLYQLAIRQIQIVLGADISDTSPSTTYGPKGGNTDLTERLDAFLDPDGGLHDIAFVTGETPLGHFSPDGTGAVIPFGKKINGASSGSTGYTVLFEAQTVDDGAGIWARDKTPSLWWVVTRFQDSCLIKGVTMEGQVGFNTLPLTSASNQVKWCALIIGNEATY